MEGISEPSTFPHRHKCFIDSVSPPDLNTTIYLITAVVYQNYIREPFFGIAQ